jgi:hypothetical protein
MRTPAISTRVKRIQRIADKYLWISGADPQDIATDLLTALQHWCAEAGVPFAVALFHAQMRVTAETWKEVRQP